MGEPEQSTAPPRRWYRTLLRIVAKGFVGLVLLGMAGWMFLAVRYADLHQTPPRTILAALISIISLGLVVVVRRRRMGLLLFLAAFVAVLVWFFSLRPSHQRDWATDVAVLPYATIEGDKVQLHNIRNFDYRSETDYTPAYYDRTLDLAKIKTVDVLLSYWSGRAIAHAFLSFGFDDGQYISVSIETRKEKSEQYSAIEGFFRQYELFYVVADERDVVRLRTNYRREEVYLYRLRATPEKARAVFLDYLKTINAIHDQPHFYNALTENCMTSLFSHLRCVPPYPPYTIGVFMSGYSARYGYEKGGLDHSVPFDELERRSHINDLANAADKAPDFSQRIRARVTTPQAPSPDAATFP
jgi:hypothetical protein